MEPEYKWHLGRCLWNRLTHAVNGNQVGGGGDCAMLQAEDGSPWALSRAVAAIARSPLRSTTTASPPCAPATARVAE
eukprot:5401269-Alexandrium_andersonii.AAC.1